MIKAVKHYVVVCDNAFCDATMRVLVDCHSYERKEQVKRKIRNRGWGFLGEETAENGVKHICPSCKDFGEGHFL